MSNKLVPLSSQLQTAIDKAAPVNRGPVLSSLLDTPEPNDRSARLEAALTTIAQMGLEASGLDAVRSVALGAWYGSHVPAERVFQGPFAVEAALLIERLALYTILPQPRKKALLSVVGPLLPAAESPSRTSFNAEFKRFLPALQPLPTRHARTA